MSQHVELTKSSKILYSSSSPAPSSGNYTRSKLQVDQCTFIAPPSRNALPRAWERRPATPFAPRTENHKIWKRCEHFLGMWGYKRDMSARCENWRSVKRLRVAGDPEGVGFVGTRFEGFGSGERRKNECAVDFDEGICLVADQETNQSSVAALEVTSTSCVTELAHSDGDARKSSMTEMEATEADYSFFQTADHSRLCSQMFQSRHTQVMSDSDRIDAMIDKLASPISLGRIGRRRSPTMVEGGIAGADGREHVQEEQHTPKAKETTHSAASQSVLNSHETAVSAGNAVTQKVSKDPPTSEIDHREYLHAFVTRAKTKKAAMLDQECREITETQDLAASSPQTRSRTALTMLDRNSSSPTKARKIETLERKVLADEGESSPLRKSNRTRLPRTQQNQSATPNMIHFRRGNGTEFIFLPKTEAQIIAMATRSNTRHNRGEGLSPRMKLEALSAQTQPSPTRIDRKRKSSKQVSWDEGLAYFAPEKIPATTKPVKGQPEEKTPVKRSRRLAQGKGTPAPKKKTAERAIDSDIETPPSTRRSARASAKSKT